MDTSWPGANAPASLCGRCTGLQRLLASANQRADEEKRSSALLQRQRDRLQVCFHLIISSRPCWSSMIPNATSSSVAHSSLDRGHAKLPCRSGSFNVSFAVMPVCSFVSPVVLHELNIWGMIMLCATWNWIMLLPSQSTITHCMEVYHKHAVRSLAGRLCYTQMHLKFTPPMPWTGRAHERLHSPLLQYHKILRGSLCRQARVYVRIYAAMR